MRVLIWFLYFSAIVSATTLNVIENDFVKIIVGPDGFDQGRFSIETTGGDPSRDNDDNLPLIYGRPKPWTSYTTIVIDKTNFGFGTQTVKRAGKKARYGQIVAKKILSDGIEIKTQIEEVFVTQTLKFFRNPLTNVKDSVLIEYHIYNDSNEEKNIGLRVMMDTMLGKNDAAPFRIGNESIIAEQAFYGDNILDYWQSFDSLVTPNVIAQGVLRYSPAALTPPDKLILMNWGTLADQPYDVNVVEGRSFIREGEVEPDTALALLWEKQLLSSKKARIYRTVMGLGGISLAPGDLSLGLSAPSELAVTDPNEYIIVAYISNTGGFSVKDSKAIISLPAGLKMVQGNQIEDLGEILANGSRQLAYKIKVDPKKVIEATRPIKLTIKSNTLSDQIIKRDVTFTGQPKLELKNVGEPLIKRGFDQFVDVPIQITNKSSVAISDIQIQIGTANALELPEFESKLKILEKLDPWESKQVSWKLKIAKWSQGDHEIPVVAKSVFTKNETINAKVSITLGKPMGKLFYSEPSFFVGDYGYIWMTLMDMPTFDGLDLTLTWDESYLKPIRVSPEPWLIESNNDIIENFNSTINVLEINDLSANNPPWRMIVGKWHFKVLEDGDTDVKLWQGNEQIDSIRLTLRKEDKLKNEEEVDFDL